MKKSILVLMLVCVSFFAGNAQTVSSVMTKVVNGYKNATDISADFSLNSSSMNVTGTIVMSGMKFRIITDDYKCWYDGKTQWVYNTATNEVNIVEPAREDLETSNPYLAVMRYNTKYKSVLKSTTVDTYKVELTSRNPYVDMTNIMLTIDKSNNLITEAVATMIDDAKQTIKFANYKKNANIPASTFVFDSKMVPEETPVIDLR